MLRSITHLCDAAMLTRYLQPGSVNLRIYNPSLALFTRCLGFMYTLLHNRQASKFDLYLPGELVASLHYKLSEDEMMFVYCEAVEKSNTDVHCKELVNRTLQEVRNRRLKIIVSCPIALTHLEGKNAH